MCYFGVLLFALAAASNREHWLRSSMPPRAQCTLSLMQELNSRSAGFSPRPVLSRAVALLAVLLISGLLAAQNGPQDRSKGASTTDASAQTRPGRKKKHKSEEKREKHSKKPPDLSSLWNDPGDIKSRDLIGGPGGRDHAPKPPLTFEGEDAKGGSNPKFDVRDASGEKWKAKLGVEAKPETAAVRLLWAIGYFADEDYLLPEVKIENMPVLQRGGKVADANGIVHGVRLKRRSLKKTGTWKWKDNPFLGTREFNGLRVMMALLNNWDLKDENNAIYENKDTGRKIYLVSDVGSSFGTTGYYYYGGWSKGDLAAYSKSKFISHVHGDYVDFNAPTHPPFIYAFGVVRWSRHIHERSTTKHVPRADAKWVGSLLAQLTPQQIKDAFLAAGYSDAQADILRSAVQQRIAELNHL